MKKIHTIFKRDFEGNRGVIDELNVEETFLKSCYATEKVDGTNIRITVRNKQVVRIEKRRNPSKLEKAKGIIEPWYIDIDEYAPENKWIIDAVKNANTEFDDGEYSCEAFGKNIQGNPLNMDYNCVYFFTLQAEKILDCPITFNELKEWLPKQDSKIGKGKIEGIVWHHPEMGAMYKIKTKDFK